jgi:hypothetical protein
MARNPTLVRNDLADAEHFLDAACSERDMWQRMLRTGEDAERSELQQFLDETLARIARQRHRVEVCMRRVDRINGANHE